MTTTRTPRAGRRADPAVPGQRDVQGTGQQRMRWGRFVWQVLSGVVVMVIVAVAAAALVVPRVLGGAGLVVETGSMRPALQPGDFVAVVDVDPNDLRTGDIVTYATENNLVTHRVVGFTAENGESRIVLQGDANDVQDKPIEPEQVRGKVLYSIPKLGFVKEWVAGHLLLLAGGLALVWAACAVVARVNRGRTSRVTAREAAAAAAAQASVPAQTAGLADADTLRRVAREAEAAARAAEQQAEVSRAAAVAALAAAEAATAHGRDPAAPAAAADPSRKEQQ